MSGRFSKRNWIKQKDSSVVRYTKGASQRIYKKAAEDTSTMGRVLGGIRLSGLSFLGGVLFLCKKAFYVFLRTNQFLHLVPCLAVVRVSGFLLGQQF